MLVSPDCVDAEPVRERLRARGYRDITADLGGFGSSSEVWMSQDSPPDVQTFPYCGNGRDKFLAQAVVEAGI